MTTIYTPTASDAPTKAQDLFGKSKLEALGGDRYNLKVIAQQIRTDIKTAKAHGLIKSDVKLSVRMRDYNCLIIQITSAPFLCVNPASVIERDNEPDMFFWKEPRLTPTAQETLNTLGLIEKQYNYNNSDPQSDYFDVNFYCWISIDDDLEFRELQGIRDLAANGCSIKVAA